MIEPIAKGLTADEFTAYVAGDLAARMGLWRPRGIVLHNTAAPTLKDFYVDTYKGHGNRPLTGSQRIANMWQRYRAFGWSGGPHLVVTDREILLGNPLWEKGVHSPSYNATYWGVELAGDFATEAFPDSVRGLGVHAIACLYAALGHEPTPATFHFHGEDMASTHRHCPGKNVGTKAEWLVMIHDAMATLHPGGCDASDPSGGLAKKAKPRVS